jgi:phosphoglycerol transferase MdoB-like AlkP superfamily enzyme
MKSYLHRNDTNTSSNAGCLGGLPTMLLVAFIILKIIGVIDWSWWWVVSPFWITAGLAVLALLVLTIISKILDKKEM